MPLPDEYTAVPPPPPPSPPEATRSRGAAPEYETGSSKVTAMSMREPAPYVPPGVPVVTFSTRGTMPSTLTSDSNLSDPAVPEGGRVQNATPKVSSPSNLGAWRALRPL